MARILLIEDSQNIADFVKRGLEHHGYEVAVAETGYAGLAAADGRFDLVVLDLMLPDVDGIEVCRRLRAQGDVGIIILTARDLLDHRVQGLEAGADDYISKPFAFEELLARVRSLLRRRLGLTDRVIEVGDLRINLERRQVWRGAREVEVTNREFELLALLAQNAGKPLRRETIIQRVWGYEFSGETDPVKVYMNYLRRKLTAEGEPDIIHTIRGFGYALK